MMTLTTIYDGLFPQRWADRQRLAPIRGRAYYVYAVFAADGTCLYVGCSNHPGQRMEKHRTANSWWPSAHRLLLVSIQTQQREDLYRRALAVEWQFMEEFRPTHNILGPANLPSKQRGAAH